METRKEKLTLVLFPIPHYVVNWVDEDQQKTKWLSRYSIGEPVEDCPICERIIGLGKKCALRSGLRSDNPYQRVGGVDFDLWLYGFESIRIISKK